MLQPPPRLTQRVGFRLWALVQHGVQLTAACLALAVVPTSSVAAQPELRRLAFTLPPAARDAHGPATHVSTLPPAASIGTSLSAPPSGAAQQTPTAATTLPALEPLQVYACEHTVLEAVSQLAEPARSLATLRDVRTDARRTVHAGGSIAEYRVAHIGFNPKLQAPTVWLWSKSGLCQNTIVGGTPAKKAAELGAASSPRARATPSKLEEHLLRGIKLQPDGQRRLTRATLLEALNHLPELRRQARVFPMQRSGKNVGWRLEFSPRAALSHLGFERGDVLQHINHFDLNSPAGALNAYQQLLRSKVFSVQLERNGKPLTLTYHVQD